MGHADPYKPSSWRLRRNSVVALLFLSTSVVGFAQAHAQATSAPSDTPAASSSQSSDKGDIIVTAQRREQRLSQVPISVQAETGRMLDIAGIHDATSLTVISPAVNFSIGYSPSASSVIIRGVSSLAQEGGLQPSTVVVLDGVPTTRAAEFDLNLADIDRIEILSGPQGTLFGKNATAGVVNIITQRPTFKLSGYAEGTATFDGEQLVRGAINVPLTNSIALRVNGYYDHLSPLGKNIFPGGDQPLAKRSYGIQGRLLFNLSDRTNFLLTASFNHDRDSFSRNEIIIPDSGALGILQRQLFGVPFGRNGYNVQNYNNPQFNRFYSNAITGELNSDLGGGFKLISVTGFRYFHIYDDNDIDAGPFGGTIDANGVLHRVPNPGGWPIESFTPPNFQTERFKYYSEEVRLAYSSGRADAILGAFYQHYRESRYADYAFLFGGTSFSRNAVSSKLGDDTAALFADVTYKVFPTVSVFGGLRYTHEKVKLDYLDRNISGLYNANTNVVTYNPDTVVDAPIESKTENDISGRAGIQWQPTEFLNYYFSYNRAYKGPGADESHGAAADPPGTRIIKPEIASAFELGAKQRLFNGLLDLDIALYDQKVKNIQQVAATPNNITQRLVNAGTLKIKGVELASHIHVSRAITLDGSLAYTDAKYHGGFVVCNAEQTHGVGRCGLDGEQSLTGRQAIGAPKWKYVVAANYNGRLTDRLNIFGRISFTWWSKIQYALTGDPQTVEPSAEQLDATLGIASSNDRWEVSIFGKNLTNHLFFADLATADGFNGVLSGYVGRDFKRYGGVRFKLNF